MKRLAYIPILALAAFAQQAPLTFDANGNLLVNIAAGGGSGGTSSADKSAFTAGSSLGTPAMGDVNPGDTPSNGTLAVMALDSSRNVKVNCVSGCSGAADTTGTGNLTALNSAVSIALAGLNSASFTLPAANNLVAVLTPEVSNDGGTTWIATYLRQNSLATNNFWQTTVSVSSTQSSWDILVTGGASNVRIRVSTYTSGSVTAAIVKGTQQPELVSGYAGVAAQAIPPYVAVVGGSDGTNARALSTNSSGQLNVLQAAANWTINLAQLAGTATSTGNGTTNAGTLRVTLSSDSTGTVAATESGTWNVTVNTALPAGGNTIGAVTQASGPWTVNATQLGGNAINTGNGTTGTGTLRVTLSSDSTGTVAATQSGTWTVQQGGAPWTVLGTLADNGAAAGTNRLPTLPGIAESNMPSAATAGRNVALRTDLQGNLLSALMPATSFTTYAAAKTGLATAASATDIAVLSGNATNTVIPVLVTMACTQTTAGIQDVQLIIRTTADSGGTSTGSPTAFPLDQNNAAAQSAVLTYTANPTVNDGTTRLIDSQHIGVLATTTASPEDIYIWRPTMGQSVVLRGTAQQLAINLNGVTWTGSSCDIKFQWIETTGL